MSSLRFATSDALLGWLKKLAGSHRVLAPRQEGPSVVFRTQSLEDLGALADATPLLRRATASPKELALPRCETLVEYSASKDADKPAQLTLELKAPIQEAEPVILFGGRPCDARGFVVLDRPYTQGKFKDPYYMARRAAMTVITQACAAPQTGCFCRWVDSSPADAEGSDIVFTAINEGETAGFVLQAFTDKGRELLDASGLDTAKVTQDALDAAHKAVTDAMPASVLDAIPAKVAARFADEAFWDKQTVKCLSCGACTYLCPTCQCFSITDEGSSLKGRRLRSWDSCMSPLFTLETSGHNPRSSKGKRMRNRISHKFSYYPETYDGNYSCVGCGRCVVSCPASVDIRSLVRLAVEGVTVSAPTAPSVAAPAAAQNHSATSSGKGKKSSGKE